MEDRLFTLDAQFLFDAVVMALSMLVLFTLLSYLLFNPVRKMLAKRKQRIADAAEAAEKDKKEALALKERYESRLAQADGEAAIILSDARKSAKSSETRIVAEARDEAARIVAHARDEAALEEKKALDDVKQEMISIASRMAGKFVTVSMDDETKERLLDETLDEIGEQTWQS